MSGAKSKICIVCATPLTIHFFFKNHLRNIAEYAEVDLFINLNNEKFTPDLDLPLNVTHLSIARQVSFISDVKVLFSLIKHLQLNDYDLVWGIGPKAGLIAMLSSWICEVRHRLFVFQGEVWASKRGLSKFFFKTMDKLTALFATSVLAVGHSEKKYLEFESVVNKNKIQVLGSGSICGVDLKKFHPDFEVKQKLRSDLSVPLTARVCLFLGRINQDKGIMDLVQAFKLAHKKSPDLFLLIIGPDEFGLNQAIQDELYGYEQFYKIIDFVADPEQYYCLADFLCLPSYREGFPISILEASACGIPSIGSDIYGINDAIVDGVTGIQYPLGNIAELGNSLLKFSNNPSYCEELGRAARNRVTSNFEQDSVCTRYVNFIKELVKN